MKTSEKLGKTIISKLRDENFKSIQELLEYTRNLSLEEYRNIPRNQNLAPELQEAEDSKMEFLVGLNSEQSKQLEKFVLSIIDNSNFILLRAAEESQIQNEGIGITYDGIPASDFSSELISGTLFGEYFSWLESHSELGKFEH